jgi:hypothetical protein
MPRAARRYDLYLPLTFNDGRPIPDEHFDAVERRLRQPAVASAQEAATKPPTAHLPTAH